MEQKVVIIGLDGTLYSLLKDLLTILQQTAGNDQVQKAKLPNLAKIFSQRYLGPMTVALPEISSVSWSSFMTGENSDTHGI